jgi:hypothetical protein
VIFYQASDDASASRNHAKLEPYRTQLSAAALRIRRVDTLVLPRLQAELLCGHLQAV